MNNKPLIGLASLCLFFATSAFADDHPVSDSVITTKVKAQLAADSQTKASSIHVTTKDGVVMLSGMADSKTEAQKAEQDAKMVDGVKEVRNKIDVKK